MLDPNAREALTEQLRPPAGYRLAHAVGTTFTLDMISALAVPLSFVRGTGEDPNNAVAVLNAVQKVADRIDIFCQAGLIRAPHRASDLLAVLEPIIHQVVPPKKHALFHPKVWLLEFERDGDYLYRFLCSSRNLTPDTSWDLLVRLDGYLPAGDDAESLETDNGPLAAFIEALPGMASLPLDARRHERINRLARSVRGVRWELPQDISTLAFRPLGSGYEVPQESLVSLLRQPDPHVGLNDRIGRDANFGFERLAITPFLDDATLHNLTRAWASKICVYGRGGEFERLSPATVAHRKLTLQAFDDSDFQPHEGPEPDDHEATAAPVGDGLRGLHAKAVFTDFGRTTYALIGSTNLTQAAVHHNVEFSVEMTGPKNRIGTARIAAALEPLPFEEFTGQGGAQQTEDEAAEWRLENALIAAAKHQFLLDAESEDGTGRYRVTIEHDYTPPENMTARIGLMTLPSQLAGVVPEAAGRPHTIHGLPLEFVTPYVLIELTDTESKLVRTSVVQGSLRTDIDGRIDHVVASQLDTSKKLREFLLLFLAPEEQQPFGSGGTFSGAFRDIGAGGSFAGLFEAIASAAASDDAATLFRDLAPVMDKLYEMSADDEEMRDVRRLWDAAIAAVGEK